MIFRIGLAVLLTIDRKLASFFDAKKLSLIELGDVSGILRRDPNRQKIIRDNTIMTNNKPEIKLRPTEIEEFIYKLDN